MNILVSGCSFSYGFGLPGTTKDPNCWANQVAQSLNASIDNVSVPGYDNTGIFLNAITSLTSKKYDLILIQLTSLGRIVVSPNIHGSRHITHYNIHPIGVSDSEYKKFYKTFVKLNQDFEHWNRLTKIIFSVQNLVKAGHNIRFINGLLNWPQELFDRADSNYAKNIIDYHNLPDSDIQIGLDCINRDKENINLDLWLNPFNSFYQLQIDQISPEDNHPGIKSQRIYAEMILKNLNL
jgi:hypothetical protein